MMDNSIYQQNVVPQSGKMYKLFLVEVDDDDRERVLSGLVRDVELITEPQWADIRSDHYHFPVRSFMTHEEVSINMKMTPRDDGTYFVIENFREEEDEGSTA